MYICIYIYIHSCIFIYRCMSIFLYLYVYVYIHIHTFIYFRACTYSYIFISKLLDALYLHVSFPQKSSIFSSFFAGLCHPPKVQYKWVCFIIIILFCHTSVHKGRRSCWNAPVYFITYQCFPSYIKCVSSHISVLHHYQCICRTISTLKVTRRWKYTVSSHISVFHHTPVYFIIISVLVVQSVHWRWRVAENTPLYFTSHQCILSHTSVLDHHQCTLSYNQYIKGDAFLRIHRCISSHISVFDHTLVYIIIISVFCRTISTLEGTSFWEYTVVFHHTSVNFITNKCTSSSSVCFVVHQCINGDALLGTQCCI